MRSECVREAFSTGDEGGGERNLKTLLRVTPTKLGTYPVVCAELCGLGHAFMRSQAHVLTQAQFDAWLAKQQQGSSS